MNSERSGSIAKGRSVLIHYHIFKNGGTSIDFLLKSAFGSRWGALEGASATDVLSSQRFGSMLEARPELLAISSHLARPPLPWEGCCPMVLLRHPIERIRSVYVFSAKDPGQPFHEVVARGGLKDYARWLLSGAPGSIVARNYQVVHLSEASFRNGHVYDAVPGEQDLREAKRLLESWPCHGIVRRFGDSCRLFQHHYGTLFPDLALREERKNVTNPSFVDEASELGRIREELGDALYEDLCDANALDLTLYEYATSLFARRLVEADGAVRGPDSQGL